MKYHMLICGCITALLLVGCSSSDKSESAQIDTESSDVHIADDTSSQIVEEPSLTKEAVRVMPAGAEILPDSCTEEIIAEFFTAQPIPDDVFEKMSGVSYHENPYISLDELRYLRMLHYSSDGSIRIGEMIVNQQIADDVLEIFSALFETGYPIESMLLIDEYGGDDEASMAANNTSCFNYREIAGTTTLSNHALGLAIDVNPLYNPYITYNADGSENVSPSDAQAYADREAEFDMKIDEDDLCLKLFSEHGFEWGGYWSSPKDYQHFEFAMGNDDLY